MPVSEFSCASRNEGNLVVIDTAGDIDLAVADRLWHEISPWLTPAARVVLDCSRVEFCDSMGLQVLLRAHRRAAAIQAVFALACPSESVWHVLTVSGLTRQFHILDSPADLKAWTKA